MTLHAYKHEIDLLGCTIGLEMDASLLVAGFKDAHVADLSCARSECIEHGLFGVCTVTDYTFETSITFGDRLVTGGEQSAQWELCGVEYPNHTIDIGVDSINPGLRAAIKIRATGLFEYEIREITNFETQWGDLQNFRCGFSALPDFIGSVLENWCANIIEWSAEKVQVHLKDDIDKLLLDLIHTFLDISTPPTTTTTTEAGLVMVGVESWSGSEPNPPPGYLPEDTNKGFGFWSKYVYVKPRMERSASGCAGFEFRRYSNSVSHARATGDLAEGAGGRYRYIVPVGDVPPEYAVKRVWWQEGRGNNHGNCTEDINVGRGGRYLYFCWSY